MDLQSEEVQLFLRSQIILNLHNGLQPLHRPLGKVIEAFVILVAFNRIEPCQILYCGRAHPTLCEQTKESNHVGLSVGSYLENSEPKILKDLDEERVQREPHSELEVTLRQSDIAIRMSMRSLRIIRLNHLEAILLRYPCTILRHNKKLEVTTVDHYFLIFFLTLVTRSRHRLLRGLHSSPGHKTIGDFRYRLGGRSAGLRDLPR